MKKSKTIRSIALLVLALFLVMGLSAFTFHAQDAPPASTIEIPQELKDLLYFGLVTLFTGALKWTSVKIGKDISGWSSIITAGAVSLTLAIIGALLSAVPSNYNDLVVLLLKAIVAMLGSMGVYGIKRQAVAPVVRKGLG